jgi:hypothetical protein
MMFEKRVLGSILLGPETEEVIGRWRNCIIKSFIICSLHLILLEYEIKYNKKDLTSRTHGENEQCIQWF